MTALPNAAELHRMARAGHQPTAFAEQRESIARAQQALNDERAAMYELVRAAHEQGVGPAVLARWSGYAPAHVYEKILGPQT